MSWILWKYRALLFDMSMFWSTPTLKLPMRNAWALACFMFHGRLRSTTLWRETLRTGGFAR